MLLFTRPALGVLRISAPLLKNSWTKLTKIFFTKFIYPIIAYIICYLPSVQPPSHPMTFAHAVINSLSLKLATLTGKVLYPDAYIDIDSHLAYFQVSFSVCRPLLTNSPTTIISITRDVYAFIFYNYCCSY